MSDLFQPGTRAFYAAIVAAAYLLLSVAAVLVATGWGWAIPWMLTFPLGSLAERALDVALNSVGPGNSDGPGWKRDAFNWLIGAFYFLVGPVWIWIISRGFTRLILGPEPKRTREHQA